METPARRIDGFGPSPAWPEPNVGWWKNLRRFVEDFTGKIGVVAAVMDKAYDSHAIRQFLAALGIEAVIPPRANRSEPIHYDAEKYKLREKVERWFNKLKQFRRIATRYDKLIRTFTERARAESDGGRGIPRPSAQ